MARRTPPGKIRLRISRECPPPPKVPSKKTAPGVGWRIDIASSKSTGTCFGPPGRDESAAGVAVSSDLVGELGEVVGGGVERLRATFTPDLADVVDAHNHGAALDPRGLTRTRGDQGPALAAELDLVGLREEAPDQVALAGLGRGADAVLLGHPIPLRRWIDPQAVLGRDRDHRAPGQLLPEPGRKSQPPLGVETATVLAEKHPVIAILGEAAGAKSGDSSWEGRWRDWRIPTFHHLLPLRREP